LRGEQCEIRFSLVGEHYEFVDVWTIPAPVDLAWRMVDDVASWPAWWPDYKFAANVSNVAHGAGARWRVRVKSDLPYTLAFEFTVLEHVPPRYVKVHTEGFFDGVIDWTLDQGADGSTRLTLHEVTETRWALINLTARLGGRRLLEKNHRTAMRRGEAGMKAALARGLQPPDHDGVSQTRT
jgi:uncharacterized protein YndB with AHSA1/START domain